MEEVNQENSDQNDPNGLNPNPNEESETINIGKKKIYLAIGILLIAVILGAVLFVAWDIYKRNAGENEIVKSGEEAANQETPSVDNSDISSTKEGSDNEGMFDLFSEKYIVINDNGSASSQDSGGSSSGGSSGEVVKPLEVKIKWKTYINSDLGYMLQYPENWKVSEINEYNETITGYVRYIKIESPKNKYALIWGIKEDTDTFYISDRTGVGMGDLVSDKKITILDTDVEIKKFVYEGKIVEYLAQGIMGGFKTKDGKHSCLAAFHSNADEYLGKSSSPNIPEVETAKEILETIQIIPRSGKICQSELTEQDKAVLDGMGAFYNKTYKYVFRISSDWKKSDAVVYEKMNPDKIITYINEKDPYERFQIRSEEYAWFDIPKSWTEFSTKEIGVACNQLKSNVHYYKRNDMVFLVTYFKHNDKRHSVYYGFKSPGASITSSVIEMYEAMLKSIVFGE